LSFEFDDTANSGYSDSIESPIEFRGKNKVGLVMVGVEVDLTR